jgi:hypothetical protein
MLINEDNSHVASFGMSSTAVGGRRRRRIGRLRKTKRSRSSRSSKRMRGSRRMRTKRNRRKYRGGVNPTYSAYSVGDNLSRSESALATPPPIKKIDLFN